MKIKRDAFLYMDPSGDNQKEFGQCATCKMSVPLEGGNQCSILGIRVEAGDSCGLYVPGEADKSEAEHIDNTVSPEEAGYVQRQVRCENCAHFDAEEGECELFEALTAQWPQFFDLDPNVDPQGCCNAQVPKPAPNGGFEALEREP